MAMKKAVILLSGGLDSATVLAFARKENFECYTMSFDYGQQHRCELHSAENISKLLGAKMHRTVKIDLSAWGGSALTDHSLRIPDATEVKDDIPITYVPARNLIFLSLATAWAEVLGAKDIFLGVNSVDYSNYPDCRKAFIDSFSETARLGTKAVDENWRYEIHAPLQNMGKDDIVRLGVSLGVDYSMTVSCYRANSEGLACGTCASCVLRKEGFEKAGIKDPTRYLEK